MTPADLIKPLVWCDLEQDRGDGTSEVTGDLEAVSAFGVYSIRIGFGSDCYYWFVEFDRIEIGRNFEDLTYAQAAAQAHHVAAVTAYIDPDAIAKIRADALREAATKATSFLVGDPKNDIPLRNPMAHEIAAAILALIQKEKDDE